MGGSAKKVTKAWKTNVSHAKSALDTNWQNTLAATETNINKAGDTTMQNLENANMVASSNLGNAAEGFFNAVNVNMAGLMGRSLDKKGPPSTETYANYSEGGRKRSGRGKDKSAFLQKKDRTRQSGKEKLRIYKK